MGLSVNNLTIVILLTTLLFHQCMDRSRISLNHQIHDAQTQIHEVQSEINTTQLEIQQNIIKKQRVLELRQLTILTVLNNKAEFCSTMGVK